MQLKGLVRFFTILLILYSLYQLSFTWLVKNFEKEAQQRAVQYVNKAYPRPSVKHPGNKDSQALWQSFLDKRVSEYADSLIKAQESETVLPFGINGAVSYRKAKEEELNLGLDLQGGMSVTLEVEMSALLRNLANNSAEPSFLKAISLAESDSLRKESQADFITLFFREYKKLEPQKGKLGSLFATNDGDKTKVIDFSTADSKVEEYIRDQALTAFKLTFERLRNRIDQYGVAQPSITQIPSMLRINVELPGIKDKSRVEKLLISTANLQFWELYTLRNNNYGSAWQRTSEAFNKKYGGSTDTTTGQKDTTNSKGLPTPLAKQKGFTIDKYIKFPIDSKTGQLIPQAFTGTVLIKDTAIVRNYLEEFKTFFPSDVKWAYGIPEKDKKGVAVKEVPLFALRTFGRTQAKLEGDAISEAKWDIENGQIRIEMRMRPYGANIWKNLTTANVGNPIAIVLDNMVYSAPNVNEPIPNGTSSITGSFTQEEANDLVNVLKIGKLPAPAKIIEKQEVGPTLGKEALDSGTLSFIIAFVVIFLLMLLYYNSSGWIANIALILNLLFTLGILSGVGASLTAPGIAGLVLTIGMAVDTNVVIYERIKEELKKGKGYLTAIKDGYSRSLPPVLDGHVTTLLTAIILYYFGLGPVKGFATTQIIGLLLSLFCGILVSRWISDMFTNKKKHVEYFTTVSKKIFQHAKYKFIEYRKIAYVISLIVLLGGVGSFFNGFNYGVEFNGGRSFTVQLTREAEVEKIRAELTKTFEGENTIIKTLGDKYNLDITTSYLITDSRGPVADEIVSKKLFEGLTPYIPATATYETFKTENVKQVKKVLPTISDDLKAGAVKATVFALLVIFLYIFIRFRDWRYSMGTIVALLHDVLVTLIVFSFAKDLVPFPLEIDQHFIAAVLTVIGFSMNDTVIVFDRIREDSRLMPTAPRAEIINRAINETLSRTIMTSLTVFLTILILFLVGSEVTRGFAFAMLIGVITGVYSSIFVAAPILVDLEFKKTKKPKS